MKIKITDLIKNLDLHPDDWSECKIMQTNIINHDSEKGSSTKEVIVKRLSDEKYFKIEYTQWLDDREFEDFAYEVFPKIIKTIIYEERKT